MKIPSLDEVNDTLPPLRKRRAEISAEAQRLRAEILALARSSEDDATPNTTAAAALSLLGRSILPSRRSRPERLAEMNSDIRTHEAAADLLAREIEAEENRASAIIRERFQPEHDRLHLALCQALLGAQKANATLTELRDALEASGVRGVCSMGASLPPVLGGASDPNAAGNLFLREAAKAGLVATKDLPGAAR